VKFCTEIDRKHIHRSCVLTTTNMATVRNFEIISGKFNFTAICNGDMYTEISHM
jgi:hypothetical protein